MALGVALYVTGDGEARIKEKWTRILAAGFPSPARVPGQRPHVSFLNGEGDLAMAEAVSAKLEAVFARVAPILSELQQVAFFAGEKRVAYYPLHTTPQVRALHETIYENATARGVRVRDNYAPGAWVPHCSLSGHVPEQREAGFMAALGEEPSPSVVFGAAGVAYWTRGEQLTQVGLFTLGAEGEP